MTADYDVLPFSDGSGALYLGAHRNATYQWVEAGYTAIHLYERTGEHEGRCRVDKH